ncbi:alpha-amylase/4-alpha-glucanotransferase domain-containing protein [Spirochaeta africana]|uniref:Alpha-amylase/alpha-mannosidase n=1 Tax=Spirochaeta africana (strain ATCC 700263 / DSM 8902 / Z-7692) TaxID=889378 RepID=H9UHZ7_SPIAZ|nr:alpha-amylase/4-alpha-glucanotransferase domain-containing protein [Spirochaeta africana]AFG37140.1 hypothetical protein Spiaf_1053 [Spirochaeta africana DSM 8902]
MKNKLIFGTYNSLPVGTSDEVLEEYYQTHYKPFLQKLYTHPDVQAVVYYCGILLEWLSANHSEFIDVLSEMVGRRQIEVIGGGFYEPILSMIPRQDRVGQIELMTTMLRKQFGRRPRGCWIPEMVWEPGLTSSLCSSGMEYTFLEDSQFIRAGMRGDQLFLPAVTEDQGKTLTVFPLHTGSLDAFLPEIALHSPSDEHHRLLVRIIPGENASDQSLDEVLAAIEQGSVDTVLPFRYLRSYSRRQRGYFPSSSSAAVHRWAQPPQPQRDHERAENLLQQQDLKNVCLEGGFFRNFLIRYPEVSRLYAKMQYTHILVNQIRGDKQRKQAAREELWRGQHHSAYWHGRSAGVYNRTTRSELYRSLIQAEKMARERGIFKPSIITLDFDMDGVEEYLYQGVAVNGYVHSLGGSLFELDSIKTQHNYMNTMARHPEVYHSEDAIAFGYDSYSRTAFLDHFIPPDATQEDFETGVPDGSSRFHLRPYRVIELNRDQHQLVMEIDGPVGTAGGYVRLEKAYSFSKQAITVSYTITNTDEGAIDRVFMPEINLAFADLGPAALRVWVCRDTHASEEVAPEGRYQGSFSRVQFQNNLVKQHITVALDGVTEIWGNPMRTRTLQRDGSTATVQQGCTVLPRWRVQLAPGESWKTTISLQLSS